MRIKKYIEESMEEWRDVKENIDIYLARLICYILHFFTPIILFNFILSLFTSDIFLRVAGIIIGTFAIKDLLPGLIKNVLPSKTASLLTGEFITEIDNFQDLSLVSVGFIIFLSCLIIGKKIINNFNSYEQSKGNSK